LLILALVLRLPFVHGTDAEYDELKKLDERL
jgi:hypothetical protein